MWTKTSKVVLILGLIAVVGGIDILFGCCMETAIEEGQTHNVLSNDKEANTTVVSTHVDTNINVGPFKRIREYLPKTKIDIFNTVIIGFVLIFGFSFFISLLNTRSKNVNSVHRAEKLEQSLDNPVNYRQDKIEFVQNLLCKPLDGSNERPPLNSPTAEGGTNYVTSDEIDSTDVDTIGESLPNSGSHNEPAPVAACTRIGIKIYYILHPVAPSSYQGIIPAFNLAISDYDTILTHIEEASNNDCGSGFFQKIQRESYDAISFDGENKFVRDAINDATCHRAAVATFPLLEQLKKNIEGDFDDSFDYSGLVVKNLQDAIKIAEKKNCGNGFLTFRPQGGKLRLTYNGSNTYILNALEIYKNEKSCRYIADYLAVVLQGQDALFTETSNAKTLHDRYKFKSTLRSLKSQIEDSDCGNGFFSIIRSDTVHYKIMWGNINVYIIEAIKKATANGNCMKASMEVRDHLNHIGVSSPNGGPTIWIPDIGDDIAILMSKINIAEGLDCGMSFYTIIQNDDKYYIYYNRNNIYVRMAYLYISIYKDCIAKTRGILRRLIDLGLHTRDIDVSATIIGQPELIAEMKERVLSINEVNCVGMNYGDTFAFSESGNQLTITYQNTNSYVSMESHKVIHMVWCPKASYLYSYILHENGYSMNDNSNRVIIILDDKVKELVNTAITQTNGINCGPGYYSVSINGVEATFSWGRSNSYVEKAWTDVRTSLKPLY